MGGLLLAACAPRPEVGSTGAVAGFIGAVASDEPRAALVAREILSAGGTAADAATALYFAAAVTYPAAASLGGGGTCLVRDGPTKKTEALDFLARAPADGGGPRPFAVPGNVRGMFALHAKYGRLPWTRLISPAEQLARFGHRASRALVRDLELVGADFLADPGAQRTYGSAVPREGELIVQLDLAASLTQIRTAGPGDFYTGALARRLVAGAPAAGGRLGDAELRSYAPAWQPTIQVTFGNYSLHATPLPAIGGLQFAALWQMLTAERHYPRASAEERPHLLAEAGLRLNTDRGTWLRLDGSDRPTLAQAQERVLDPRRLAGLLASYRAEAHAPAAEAANAPLARTENPAAMSFTVVDSQGSAVACTVSLNNLFGTGRIAPGTGIVLAAAPSERRGSPLSPTQLLVVNHNVNDVYLAAAASGGTAAPTALLGALLAVLVDEAPLAEAVQRPRVHHGGVPDVLAVEAALPKAVREALTRRGHRLQEVPEIGRVNAIHCPEGARQVGKTCVFASDGRGFGLATGG